MRQNKAAWHVLFLSLLFAMTTRLASFGQGMPPTLVVTDEVRSHRFHDQIRLVGRAEAWNQSRIVSQVSGRVEKIDALEGMPVAAGERLISIDNVRIRLLHKAKAAEATQALLQAELAREQLERARELHAQSLISETSLDSARAWDAISEAARMKAEADRDRLDRDVRDCSVRAPFSGVTGRRLINAGEWVNPGTEVMELAALDSIRIVVDLPERYYGQLSVGSTVAISASNNASQELIGRVTGISATASKETHTFPVFVAVSNPDFKLAGGMLVKATLTLNKAFTSLAVSKDAIIRQGGQTMVYTIRDGKAAPMPVLTSSTDGELIAVVSDGLSEGMPIVVRGNERIFPGAPVRTASDGPPGGDPSGHQPAAHAKENKGQ
ncbi:MAG: efflux RND transporter periplasmic adaptor subunit [Candidatus Zixiibacteriota bacterium]